MNKFITKARKKNNKENKAFTLAEMMIIMLIMSLVTVAFAPMITNKKKHVAPPGSIWQYTDNGSDIYYPANDASTIMLGTNTSLTDSTQYARLLINTETTSMPNQIFFGQKTLLGADNFVGKLAMDTSGNVGLSTGTVSGGNSTVIGHQTNAIAAHSAAIGADATSVIAKQMTLGSIVDEVHIKGTLTVTGKTCFKFIQGNNTTISPYNSFVYTKSADTGGANSGLLYRDYAPSDKRLKNIQGLNLDGIDKIQKLKIYNYTMKKDKKNTPQVGVIAQDLQKIFPNAITKDYKGYLMIRKTDMFYAMVNAIQSLDKVTAGVAKNIEDLKKACQPAAASVKQLENKIIILTKAENSTTKKIKQLADKNKQLEAKNKQLKARLAKLEGNV